MSIYAKSENGGVSFHGKPVAGGVKITQKQHEDALALQSSPENKYGITLKDGKIVLIEGSTQQEKDRQTKAIKRKRNENMDYVTVNYDSKDWSFTRVNRQDFFMKLMRGKSFDWKADDATVVELTIEKANEIADLVEASLTKTFFDAEKEISEL